MAHPRARGSDAGKRLKCIRAGASSAFQIETAHTVPIKALRRSLAGFAQTLSQLGIIEQTSQGGANSIEVNSAALFTLDAGDFLFV